MKRVFGIIAVFLCIGVLLTACGKNNNNIKSNLSGTSSDILKKLVSKASELDTDKEYGINSIKVEENIIDKDEVEDILGLTEDEFKKYVESAVESKPVDSWYNHSVVVVKLKDGVNVKEIAEKIVANTSPSRFGCLKANKIEGAYSGNYVIFAASYESTVDVVIKAFKEMTNGNMKTITRENNWDTGMFDE